MSFGAGNSKRKQPASSTTLSAGAVAATNNVLKTATGTSSDVSRNSRAASGAGSGSASFFGGGHGPRTASRDSAGSSSRTAGSVNNISNNNHHHHSHGKSNGKKSAAASSARSTLPWSATRDIIGPDPVEEAENADPLEFPEEAALRRFKADHKYDFLDGGALLPFEALLKKQREEAVAGRRSKGTIGNAGNEPAGGEREMNGSDASTYCFPPRSELDSGAFDALAVMERLTHTRRLLDSLEIERQECKRHMNRGRELYLMSPRIKDFKNSNLNGDHSHSERGQEDFCDSAKNETDYVTPSKQQQRQQQTKPSSSAAGSAAAASPAKTSVFSRLASRADADVAEKPVAKKGAAAVTASDAAAPAAAAQLSKTKTSPVRKPYVRAQKQATPTSAAAVAAAAANTPTGDIISAVNNRSAGHTSDDDDDASRRERHADFSIPDRFSNNRFYDPDAPVIVRTALPENAMHHLDYHVVITSAADSNNASGQQQQRHSSHTVHYPSPSQRPPALGIGMLQQRNLYHVSSDPHFGNNLDFTSGFNWQ